MDSLDLPNNSSYDDVRLHLLNAPPYRWVITGVGGFVGSNLLYELLKLNQIVSGLDNFSTGNEENLSLIKSLVSDTQWQRFSLIRGDIRNIEECRVACSGANFVLHQAALGSVPRSIINPLNTNSCNIDGFLNMLTVAKDTNIQKFIYAASSSTYGDHPALPKVEYQIGSPLSPYAITKLVNEQYSKVFELCYGFKSIGLRYFNVFGPHQKPDGPYAAVIPKWILAMIKNEPIIINGDGKTSRDFSYIANIVQANILAACKPIPNVENQIYNVAVGQSTTLNDLFKLIKEYLSKKYSHLKNYEPIYHKFRTGDIRHSLADITKIKQYYNYCPTHTIASGLIETIDWFIKESSHKSS